MDRCDQRCDEQDEDDDDCVHSSKEMALKQFDFAPAKSFVSFSFILYWELDDDNIT